MLIRSRQKFHQVASFLIHSEYLAINICLTKPGAASTQKIHVLQVHVTNPRFTKVFLQIDVYKSTFHKSMFYKSLFTNPRFTNPCLQIHVSQIHTLQILSFYNMPQI